MKDTKPGIFVIGCPRSGTYLMSMLLNHHFSTAIPLETHFIPLFKRQIALWGDLSQTKNRLSLMESIFDFLEIWTHYESTDRNYKKEKLFSLLEVREQALRIAENSSGYPQMVEGLFKAYAYKKGLRLWGDKSAFHRHQPLELLVDSTENIKFIHMIRDPRDVSLSWKKIWVGPRFTAETGFAWREHIKEKRHWGKRHPQQYIEIKYEDLISNTQQVLEIIGEYLGTNIENADIPFWESSFAKTLAEGKTHALLNQAMKTDNIFKWKNQMRSRDIDILERICWNELKELGYPTINAQKPGSCTIRGYIVLQVFLEYLTIRRVKLIVKQILPFIIFASRKIRISLPRIFLINEK